jgi:pimeloyl-ACP methyl ester carboxylesterase
MPFVDLTPESAPSAPVAVILPGSGYTIQAPLLYWGAEILKAGGWRVLAVSWSPADLLLDDPRGFVEAEVEAAFAAAPAATTRLLFAKSLGTFAAPWAAAHGIAGVWLTPVLTISDVSDALNASVSTRDLIIGGTADPLWRSDAIAATAASVLEIPDANHALVVPGDWRRSGALHAEVFAVVEEHLGRLIRES